MKHPDPLPNGELSVVHPPPARPVLAVGLLPGPGGVTEGGRPWAADELLRSMMIS